MVLGQAAYPFLDESALDSLVTEKMSTLVHARDGRDAAHGGRGEHRKRVIDGPGWRKSQRLLPALPAQAAGRGSIIGGGPLIEAAVEGSGAPLEEMVAPERRSAVSADSIHLFIGSHCTTIPGESRHPRHLAR
ncbi:unnamed protein product [Lampetra fluviatilis]